MNKLKATKYAENFVNDFLEEIPNFDTTREINIIVSKEAPINDPNLEILKSKFLEIGFKINVDSKTGFGTINKIN